MFTNFCKQVLQTGHLVGMFIQYMFLWSQCWKQIIPESLFITMADLLVKPVIKKKKKQN